jgi:putative chitobiose transport system permease protein
MSSNVIRSVRNQISMRIRNRSEQKRFRTNWSTTICAALLAFMFIIPAIWLFVGSIRPNNEILATMSTFGWDLIIPSRLTFENYYHLFADLGFGAALWTSFFTSGVTVLVGLFLALLAAYALGVLNFPGRSIVFSFVVISFMMPFEAIAIPLSQVFTKWGLANTYLGLILPGIANGLAIFNLRQYFMGIPKSFRESAKLDGASEPMILFKIYLRLSTPGLINSALLIFVGSWTAYLWPLLIVSENHLQVAPVALARAFGEHASSYGQNFAGSVILSLVPAVAIFALQRHFGRFEWGSEEK